MVVSAPQYSRETMVRSMTALLCWEQVFIIQLVGNQPPSWFLFLLLFGFNLRKYAALSLKLQITSEQHFLNNNSGCLLSFISWHKQPAQCYFLLFSKNLCIFPDFLRSNTFILISDLTYLVLLAVSHLVDPCNYSGSEFAYHWSPTVSSSV